MVNDRWPIAVRDLGTSSRAALAERMPVRRWPVYCRSLDRYTGAQPFRHYICGRWWRPWRTLLHVLFASVFAQHYARVCWRLNGWYDWQIHSSSLSGSHVPRQYSNNIRHATAATIMIAFLPATLFAYRSHRPQQANRPQRIYAYLETSASGATEEEMKLWICRMLSMHISKSTVCQCTANKPSQRRCSKSWASSTAETICARQISSELFCLLLL